MRVLLSIKPEYVEKIFSGEKRYEFRKVLFRRPGIRVVVIYASAPVQRVVGEFAIDGILAAEKKDLWKQTHKHSGISEDFFNEYFRDKRTGFAIKIGNVTQYERGLPIWKSFGMTPPQSFAYL